MVIDDVPVARKSLIKDINEHCPGVEIAGEAGSVIEAGKMVQKIKPDLLFLDIDLGDGDGFDVIDILNHLNLPIIFTTASDQHAIKAFRYKAIDYLLKPISPEQLKEAVAKVMAVIAGKNKAGEEKQPVTIAGKLALHTADFIKVVDTRQIIRLEADGNYTRFYLKSGEKVLITRTLKEYDELLAPQGFLRVHQSHLINLDQIESYVKSDGGYIRMKDQSRVPVSVRKKSMVIDRIQEMK